MDGLVLIDVGTSPIHFVVDILYKRIIILIMDAKQEGLKLIWTIDPDAELIPEHDQIYVHPKKKITNPDVIKHLKKLGWFKDSASETCWSLYC